MPFSINYKLVPFESVGQKKEIIMSGRAKPMATKAGLTKKKRRYSCGGKVKK